MDTLFLHPMKAADRGCPPDRGARIRPRRASAHTRRMTEPDPPFPAVSFVDCERLAGENLMGRLRGDEPGGVLNYIKVLEWLRQVSVAGDQAIAAAPPPGQAAEAIFTLAAQLAFALLEAPETAPAAFIGLVEAWRAEHLPPGEAGVGLEAARAALRRYLDLSEADAVCAAQLREG